MIESSRICTNRILGALICVTGGLFQSAAFGTFLTPGNMGATHNMLPLVNGAFVSYDAATDMFTATNSGVGQLVSFSSSSSLANDINFEFLLEADIDETGFIAGGNFEWVASSVALGILSPTTLISGQIESAPTEFFTSCSAAFACYQFHGSVTQLDSVFASIVGDMQSFMLELQGSSPCPSIATAGAFGCSFAGETATSAPDLFLVPNAISEPTTFALLIVGIIGAGMTCLRRCRAR